MQIVLDKGQREDWFESRLIIALSAIAAVALVTAILWERKHDHPVIDLTLFRDRSFAVSNAMMFMLGFVLLGSTLLIPLFAQTMLGYPATDAGLALMPGGLIIICSMPLVGFLLSRRFDPRVMMAFGLTMVSLSLFYMTGFNLTIDFWTLATARMLQGCGLGFLFVPINTVAYSYLPPEKNNAASGIINLSRNVGASVGISIVTTMLDRQGQFHRDRLAAHLDPANANVQAMLDSTSAALQAHGASTADAMQQAYAMLQVALQRQAGMLAYMDNFWMLALATLLLIPFVLLVRKPKRGGRMHAH